MSRKIWIKSQVCFDYDIGALADELVAVIVDDGIPEALGDHAMCSFEEADAWAREHGYADPEGAYLPRAIGWKDIDLRGKSAAYIVKKYRLKAKERGA